MSLPSAGDNESIVLGVLAVVSVGQNCWPVLVPGLTGWVGSGRIDCIGMKNCLLRLSKATDLPKE
jgi:hypothetical protein